MPALAFQVVFLPLKSEISFSFCHVFLQNINQHCFQHRQALRSAVLKMPGSLASHLPHKGITGSRKQLVPSVVQLSPGRVSAAALLHTLGTSEYPQLSEGSLHTIWCRIQCQNVTLCQGLAGCQLPQGGFPSGPRDASVCDLLRCSSKEKLGILSRGI